MGTYVVIILNVGFEEPNRWTSVSSCAPRRRLRSCEAMKLVITSDLHQRIAKWDDLVPTVQTERARFVLIAGDLLPKASFKQQKTFFGKMRQWFYDMKQFGSVTVLTYLGNDDAHVLEPLLDELQAEELKEATAKGTRVTRENRGWTREELYDDDRGLPRGFPR